MVTERDETLLVELEGLKYITARHCVGTMYVSLRIAQRHLQKLYDKGLITRYASGRCAEYIYHLPKRKPAQLLQHMMASLELWKLCRASNRLAQWDSERVIDYKIDNKADQLRPDAMFVLSEGTGETLYAYEFEPCPIRQRIVNKVKQYEEWANSGSWRTDPGRFPQVIIHTPNASTVQRLIETVKTNQHVRWIVREEMAGMFTDTTSAPGNSSATSVRWRSSETLQQRSQGC